MENIRVEAAEECLCAEDYGKAYGRYVFLVVLREEMGDRKGVLDQEYFRC